MVSLTIIIVTIFFLRGSSLLSNPQPTESGVPENGGEITIDELLQPLPPPADASGTQIAPPINTTDDSNETDLSTLDATGPSLVIPSSEP